MWRNVMLTLEIQSQTLADKINNLLIHQFENNPDKMLQELVENYIRRQSRLAYSGILTWQKDGLEYQKEIRHEWQ